MSDKESSRINASDFLFTVGSGNIFADLGLLNPEGMLVKAELSKQIYLRLQDRQLVDDSDLLGLDIDQMAALMAGKSSGLSIEQLFQVLNALEALESLPKNHVKIDEKQIHL
jgi:predicted XRE-type DNA-binding protein